MRPPLPNCGLQIVPQTSTRSVVLGSPTMMVSCGFGSAWLVVAALSADASGVSGV
jgi:hypothetical protein